MGCRTDAERDKAFERVTGPDVDAVEPLLKVRVDEEAEVALRVSGLTGSRLGEP